jgi:hypothetical protein
VVATSTNVAFTIAPEIAAADAAEIDAADAEVVGAPPAGGATAAAGRRNPHE